MFKILAETHRIIVEETYKYILEDYNIKLNLDKLKWGSVAPDVLPYYRLKRHYLDESVSWISKEISNLIYLSRYHKFGEEVDSFFMKFFSRQLGIIFHYLSDYNCYPHATRMTYTKSMREHMKYESEMNIYAKNHKFEFKKIELKNIDLYGSDLTKLNTKIEEYIKDYVKEYLSSENSFSNDMDFAFSLCLNISSFVFATILNYTEDMEYQFI